MLLVSAKIVMQNNGGVSHSLIIMGVAICYYIAATVTTMIKPHKQFQTHARVHFTGLYDIKFYEIMDIK